MVGRRRMCVCTLRIDFVRVPLGRPSLLLLLLLERGERESSITAAAYALAHSTYFKGRICSRRCTQHSTAASLPFFFFFSFSIRHCSTNKRRGEDHPARILCTGERERERLEDERFSNVQEWWNLFPRRVASKSIRRQMYILKKKDERKKERKK